MIWKPHDELPRSVQQQFRSRSARLWSSDLTPGCDVWRKNVLQNRRNSTPS